MNDRIFVHPTNASEVVPLNQVVSYHRNFILPLSTAVSDNIQGQERKGLFYWRKFFPVNWSQKSDCKRTLKFLFYSVKVSEMSSKSIN